MKSLTQHIAEKLIIFPSQLDEKLVINKDFVDSEPEKIKCDNDNIYNIVIAEVHKQSDNGQTRLHPINLNHIDVSEVTDMCCLFDAINDKVTLRYIDISDWNVSNVDRMRWMFSDCKELVSVGDLSNWDIRKLTNAEGMFKHCKKLTYVGDISKWNPESLRDYGVTAMFIGCRKLRGNVGNLSKWNVSPVVLQKLRIQGIL